MYFQLFQKKERIELDYIICALLAEMIEDEKGLKLAFSQLKENGYDKIQIKVIEMPKKCGYRHGKRRR